MKRFILMVMILAALASGGCSAVARNWLSIFDWSKDSNGEYTGR